MKPEDRVIIIGQAPNATGDPDDPLGGRISEVIGTLSGLLPSQLDSYFDLRNLIPTFPGKNGKGDHFPKAESIRRANLMLPGLHGRRVVLLGQNVAGAFRFPGELFFWVPHRGFEAASCPHPSGINRWWNFMPNRVAAARFFGAIVREMP